jgi:thiamine pyrophosphate-dependent acetolactate synthase large subunit-like protein
MATARHLCKWTIVLSEAEFRRGDVAPVLARAAEVARARGCPGPVAIQVPRALLLANAATGRHVSAEAMRAVPLAPPVRRTEGSSADLEAAEVAAAAEEVAEALISAAQPRLHLGLGASHCQDLLVDIARQLRYVSSSFFFYAILLFTHV